jgi:hypothetical protein
MADAQSISRLVEIHDHVAVMNFAAMDFPNGCPD